VKPLHADGGPAVGASSFSRHGSVPEDFSSRSWGLREHIENEIVSHYILRGGLTVRPEMHRPPTKKPRVAPRDAMAMQSNVQVIAASVALLRSLCWGLLPGAERYLLTG
jgi:hypothetical protein